MSFVCQYCQKVLTTKYTLINHQKTTKKCLEIQTTKSCYQDLIFHHKEITSYKCIYCNYVTLKKNNYNRHMILCKNNNKTTIEKYEQTILEKDKIILEKDKIINNQTLEILTLKTKLECQTSTSSEFKNMAMQSRQTNNYITNKQKIEYSMANLHSYDELKDNISTIIDSKFNKTSFQTIEKVATFITNDILNYNQKEYYHCFDVKGSVFHKKNGDEIDVDEKAEKLLTDILPIIVEKSRKIYIEESDRYNDQDDKTEIESKESEKDIILLSKALKNVKNIAKIGSEERNLCIKRIAACYCVSSNQLKSYFNNPKIEMVE